MKNLDTLGKVVPML